MNLDAITRNKLDWTPPTLHPATPPHNPHPLLTLKEKKKAFSLSLITLIIEREREWFRKYRKEGAEVERVGRLSIKFQNGGGGDLLNSTVQSSFLRAPRRLEIYMGIKIKKKKNIKKRKL